MPKLRAPYIANAWREYRRVVPREGDDLLDQHDAFMAGALAMFIAHRQLADIELLRVEMETHAKTVDRRWLQRISPAISILDLDLPRTI
jgi:hypothetical protein